MNQQLNFLKETVSETRKADYYLSCLDSSIFIDFNINDMGKVYLKRISFDGYGCCRIEHSETLNNDESKKFIDEMRKEIINQSTVEKLVLTLIQLNSDRIWADALKEYKLLENRNDI